MCSSDLPDKTEVYEYASASISPSAPKRSLALALGAILWLFVGTALSLVLAYLRGVYYSKNSLKIGAQARLTASVKTLLPLRNKTLEEISANPMKKSRSILRDMSVEIYKSDVKLVVVTSLRAKMTGNGVARALASYMHSESLNIAVIDFSSRAKNLDIY